MAAAAPAGSAPHTKLRGRPLHVVQVDFRIRVAVFENERHIVLVAIVAGQASLDNFRYTRARHVSKWQ